MHRLLVASEKEQVFVYSLNKQRKVQQVNVSKEEYFEKGSVLACEWIFSESANECTMFAIGFSKGNIELYKIAANDGNKPQPPFKTLNFDLDQLIAMSLTYIERGSESNQFLAISYSQVDSIYLEDSSTSALLIEESKQKEEDIDEITTSRIYSSVCILTGKKFE